MRSALRFTAEVRAALHAGAPIVALESTIISHGMKYPENVETALSLEAIIRSRGAVPAHIALLGGKVCIGLEAASLEALGRAGGDSVRKTSRRDIASVLSSGAMGATTVAGTMVCASAAGISVFATGGIGGVHRGGESSMDVSADLTELGRTPVAVVCAGIKSLLDIPRTLEFLETQGVPVVTLGSSTFPSFYSPGSIPTPERAETPLDCARMWAASRGLGLENGMVVAVPPPQAVPGVEEAIVSALEEARRRGIAGKDVTPFLLTRVAELTRGASLAANIALVKNNARVAAEMAAHLVAAAASAPGLGAAAAAAAPPAGGNKGRAFFSTLSAPPIPGPGPLATVIGGAVLDILSRPLPGKSLITGTSNPGVNTQSAGGVGRNIAEVLARLSSSSSSSSSSSGGEGGFGPPVLVSAVGADPAGVALTASCSQAGITFINRGSAGTGAARGSGSRQPQRTATYLGLLDGQGELVAAMADTSILEEALTPEALFHSSGGHGSAQSLLPLLASSRAVVCDANLPSATLCAVGVALLEGRPHAPRPPLILEPVSVTKCTRCLPALHLAALVKPNASEAVALAEAWRASVGLPALPPPSTPAGGEVEEEEEEEEGHTPADNGPDERLLAAAQSVLAAMLGARREATPLGGGSGGTTGASAAAGVGACGLIEGRKHVLVSLGPSGVLWLSCPPLPPSGAELCASLPFFSAAAHPSVGFDFQLVRPPPTSVKKVTGAGDTLLGALVWALAGEGRSMAQAVRHGLAGAKLALETEPAAAAGGAVPSNLSLQLLREALRDVEHPEEGYS